MKKPGLSFIHFISLYFLRSIVGYHFLNCVGILLGNWCSLYFNYRVLLINLARLWTLKSTRKGFIIPLKYITPFAVLVFIGFYSFLKNIWGLFGPTLLLYSASCFAGDIYLHFTVFVFTRRKTFLSTLFFGFNCLTVVGYIVYLYC